MFTILSLIVFSVSLIGLFMTYEIGKNRRGPEDEPVNGAIIRHPIMKNPVFITYIVFGIIGLGLTFYFLWYYGLSWN